MYETQETARVRHASIADRLSRLDNKIDTMATDLQTVKEAVIALRLQLDAEPVSLMPARPRLRSAVAHTASGGIGAGLVYLIVELVRVFL